MCLWPESCAGWTCYPRQQDEPEPEPDEVVEGDEDLWGRIIDGTPVTSEAAAEYLARLEQEFPADRDEDSDA